MKRVIAALLLCTSVVGAQDGSSQGDAFYAAIRANDLTSLRLCSRRAPIRTPPSLAAA